ncbi:MAG: peptidoglycan DD-metalloendopeptidase family protein [Bacillota bacterium]
MLSSNVAIFRRSVPVFFLAVLLGGVCLHPETARREAMAAYSFLPALSPKPSLSPAPKTADPGISRPRYHTVRRGETMWGIARCYGIKLAALMAANPTVIPERLPVGGRLCLPEGGRYLTGRHGWRSLIQGWQWPLTGRITSRYGWRWGRMHRGLDIAVPAGTPVRAAASGRVLFAGWQSGYGLVVILGHPDGRQTVYGHNSCLCVKAGQWVPVGAVLAKVGATGNATGPHLHFEVRVPGGYVDPLRVLP